MKRSTKFLIVAVISAGVVFFAALPVIVMPMPSVSVAPEPWRLPAFLGGMLVCGVCAATSLALQLREDCEEKVQAAREAALKEAGK